MFNMNVREINNRICHKVHRFRNARAFQKLKSVKITEIGQQNMITYQESLVLVWTERQIIMVCVVGFLFP